MGKEYVALQALDVGTPKGGDQVVHYEPGEVVKGAEHFVNLQGLIDGFYLAEKGSPAAEGLAAPATGGYEALKVDDLKAELASRDLPTSGTKPELVARLKADDSGPTKEDLYAEATELDIPGRSDMNKAELQAAVEAAREDLAKREGAPA